MDVYVSLLQSPGDQTKKLIERVDRVWGLSIPDGENATGLSKASLFLNTANTLFEDGGNLGGSGLGLSSVCSDLFQRRRSSANLEFFYPSRAGGQPTSDLCGKTPKTSTRADPMPRE
jgi:hypothetical protein